METTAAKSASFWASKKRQETIVNIFLYILAWVGAIIFLVPLIWMIVASLKTNTDVFLITLPIPPHWENYVKAWAPEGLGETFTTYSLNTIFITVVAIIGVLFSSTLVAYGFARFKFPGRDVLFLIMISTMMVPAQVTMIPTFVLFKYLGWLDSFKPLLVPTFFGGGAFNIFLIRQFFMTIPYELDDAAKIDGCNFFQILYIILLPLVKPALATVAIFSFVYNWNDFMNPLIYINSSSKYTLALGLQTFTTMYGSNYSSMMAASTIVLLPILAVFFFGQRYFIEGVATSGLKG